MPEVRGGLEEFNAYLRLALHSRADIDDLTRLLFRIRRTRQFQLLALSYFS